MSLPEAREDRLVAAIAHASVLLPLIGTLVPLIAWISQRNRSALIREQGMQALLYQAAGTLAYFLVNFCMMGSMFLMMPLSALNTTVESPSPGEVSPLVVLPFLLFIFITFAIPVMLCIAVPVYALIGCVAAWRVLRGGSFHYPLLGRLARRWSGERVPQTDVPQTDVPQTEVPQTEVKNEPE